jgi:hypothetical protein
VPADAANHLQSKKMNKNKKIYTFMLDKALATIIET